MSLLLFYYFFDNFFYVRTTSPKAKAERSLSFKADQLTDSGSEINPLLQFSESRLKMLHFYCFLWLTGWTVYYRKSVLHLLK